MTVKDRVVVYGYDCLLNVQEKEQTTPLASNGISYVNYEDTFDETGVTGIVTFQGIFEQLSYKSARYGRDVQITPDSGRILECEKKIKNVLEHGGWVAFLVRLIIDHGLRRSYEDTDLCKRMLNRRGVTRAPFKGIGGTGESSAIREEFRGYINAFGAARTHFTFPKLPKFEPEKFSTLAAAEEGAVVGLEFDRSDFYLPFHRVNITVKTITQAAESVVEAITHYRRDTLLDVPPWADGFALAKEKSLQERVGSLREELAPLEGQLLTLKKYKAVLTTGSATLKNLTVEIFKDYFGLKIDAADKTKENFKILSAGGKVIAFCETVGIRDRLKRENINQIDTRREYRELSSQVPGLLIINNAMKADGITERLKATIDTEQVTHARNLNILLLRSIDLLYLMKHLEKQPRRGETFLGLLEGGGGWLRADDKQYEVVKGS